MSNDYRDYLARLVGREIALDRAMIPLISGSRRDDPEWLHGVLKMSFEKGRTLIPERLAEAGLDSGKQKEAEKGFYDACGAILGSVKNGQYTPPAR